MQRDQSTTGPVDHVDTVCQPLPQCRNRTGWNFP